MSINKNISVWRGNTAPPTDYHLWVKDSGLIFILVDDTWIQLTVENLPEKYDSLVEDLKTYKEVTDKTLEEIIENIKLNADFNSNISKIKLIGTVSHVATKDSVTVYDKPISINPDGSTTPENKFNERWRAPMVTSELAGFMSSSLKDLLDSNTKKLGTFSDSLKELEIEKLTDGSMKVKGTNVTLGKKTTIGNVEFSEETKVSGTLKTDEVKSDSKGSVVWESDIATKEEIEAILNEEFDLDLMEGIETIGINELNNLWQG